MTIRAIVFATTFLVFILPTDPSAEVINGCIKSNGTLKIVADPQIHLDSDGRTLRS